jgi:hypothetical protein
MPFKLQIFSFKRFYTEGSFFFRIEKGFLEYILFFYLNKKYNYKFATHFGHTKILGILNTTT